VSAAITLLAVALTLFCSAPTWANTGGAQSSPGVHQLVLNDMPATYSAPRATLAAATAEYPTVAAPSNPFHLTVALGGAVTGYHQGWSNAVPGIEFTPTWDNFIGPVKLVCSVRYFDYGHNDYWREQCRWTLGAEAPVGGGVTLFTTYENHFLVNDDWLFGGIRFTIN